MDSSKLKQKVQETLLQARQTKTHWRELIRFTVSIDGATWVNEGGHNGNPWDLWLVKQGTAGKTRKTFRRISL